MTTDHIRIAAGLVRRLTLPIAFAVLFVSVSMAIAVLVVGAFVFMALSTTAGERRRAQTKLTREALAAHRESLTPEERRAEGEAFDRRVRALREFQRDAGSRRTI